jgi:F0F1-type ATP synthase assembly protein I
MIALAFLLLGIVAGWLTILAGAAWVSQRGKRRDGVEP